MPYYSKKNCVYKKEGNKKVGCTKGPIKKYMAALHANVKESLEEVTNVSPNLEFKNIRFPSKNTVIATYHYKSKKDNIDVILSYEVGRTIDDINYSHVLLKDNTDVHNVPVEIIDPKSKELQTYTDKKNINLDSEDIEKAGEDAISRIESYFEDPYRSDSSAVEESMTFESLFDSIMNEKES
jgi:hypothetical protein